MKTIIYNWIIKQKLRGKKLNIYKLSFIKLVYPISCNATSNATLHIKLKLDHHKTQCSGKNREEICRFSVKQKCNPEKGKTGHNSVQALAARFLKSSPTNIFSP